VGLDEAAVVATFDDRGVTMQRWGAGGPLLGAVALGRDVFEPLAPQKLLDDFLVEETAAKLGGTADTVWHVVCVAPATNQVLPDWWRARYDQRSFHRIVYLTRSEEEIRPPLELLSYLRPGAWNPVWRDGPYFSSVIPTIVRDQDAP